MYDMQQKSGKPLKTATTNAETWSESKCLPTSGECSSCQMGVVPVRRQSLSKRNLEPGMINCVWTACVYSNASWWFNGVLLTLFWFWASFTSSSHLPQATWSTKHSGPSFTNDAWKESKPWSLAACPVRQKPSILALPGALCWMDRKKNCKLCKPADPATFRQSLSEQSLHLECDRLDLNQFRLRHATIWKQHQNNTTFFSIQTCSKCIQHMTLWERNVRRLLSEKVTAGSEWCSNAAILLSCWLRSFCRIQRQIQALSKARRLWIGNNAGTRQFTPQVTCEHAHSMCQRAVWYLHL